MKLFRKFRFQQIKSERIIKYLLYAFGEIILVVIGILLALQINSWNQNRLERKKELGYLNEIKANIVSDSIKLQEVIAFNLEKIAIYDTIVKSFDIHNPPKDLNNYILTKVPFIAEFGIYTINSTAFNNMNSADNISIISSFELRQKLTSYYAVDPETEQEKIKLKTRELTTYLNPKILSKETAKNFLGVETMLPSLEANHFQKDAILFGFIVEAMAMMSIQIETCKDRLRYIHQVNEIIDQEIQKLSP